MPFVLVEEKGDHFDFNYRVISVYETEQAAKDAAQLYTRYNELECQIARLYQDRMCYQECSYEIVEVPLDGTIYPQTMLDLEAELQKARAWRKDRDEETESQKQLQKEKLLDYQKEQITGFLDWWDNHSHLADKEKKKTRLEIITPIAKQYLLYRDDEEARKILHTISA